jgi:hypothetical protein
MGQPRGLRLFLAAWCGVLAVVFAVITLVSSQPKGLLIAAVNGALCFGFARSAFIQVVFESSGIRVRNPIRTYLVSWNEDPRFEAGPIRSSQHQVVRLTSESGRQIAVRAAMPWFKSDSMDSFVIAQELNRSMKQARRSLQEEPSGSPPT